MNELRSWIVLFWRLLHYFPYKWGFVKEAPGIYDIFPETMDVLGRILGWHKYVFVRGAENCPRKGPAVFTGNHMKMDDAWITFRAVYLASQGLYAKFMMRNDFFSGSRLLQNRFFDVNDLTAMGGTYHVNRENVTLAQLKPFVKILSEGDTFIMFPGRTRSRTGMFVEYRDGMEEPGGVSFFIAQAQRRHPDVRVPAVPVTRTHNLINNRSSLVFGEPFYLDQNADRAEQRAFDFELMIRMGELVEINVPHLLGGILYLLCLHKLAERTTVHDLERRVAAARDRITARYIDPQATQNLGGELREALTFLQKHGQVRLAGDAVELVSDSILSAPEQDKTYKEKNPVKFFTNQVMHLPDVVSAIHEVVLP